MRALRFLMLGLALAALPVFAQGDTMTDQPINYGMSVEGEVSQSATFDWWRFQALGGDEIRVTMSASNGLAPLVGLIDQGGDLVALSENGAVDGTVQFDAVIPADGEYMLVATRVDSQNGTTTGRYVLGLQVLSAPPVSAYQEVVFPCQDFQAAAVATLEFDWETALPQPPDETSRVERSIFVSMYGFDSLQPAVWVRGRDLDECVNAGEDAVGDVITLPGGESITFSSSMTAQAAQVVISSNFDLERLTLTFAGRDNLPGRYLALVNGFAIQPADQVDEMTVRMGPLAAESTDLDFYMVGVGEGSRLDPLLALEETTCDDAGRRGCEAIPSFDGAGVTFGAGITPVLGDRFDAGVRLSGGSLEPYRLTLGSFNGNTAGEYAVVLVGALPPRTLDE